MASRNKKIRWDIALVIKNGPSLLAKIDGQCQICEIYVIDAELTAWLTCSMLPGKAWQVRLNTIVGALNNDRVLFLVSSNSYNISTLRQSASYAGQRHAVLKHSAQLSLFDTVEA